MMDIQKQRAEFEAWLKESNKHVYDVYMDGYSSSDSQENMCAEWAWSAWQQAQKVAVPEGFVLVKKRNMIGNPNVDWLQAPNWAKYWLKDGYSNKYWWSSIRPQKDMDLDAFCWKGDYFAEEAPSFDFLGSWDKSLTSRKAMIDAQEQN